MVAFTVFLPYIVLLPPSIDDYVFETNRGWTTALLSAF
jgi:hypothetical protein